MTPTWSNSASSIRRCVSLTALALSFLATTEGRPQATATLPSFDLASVHYAGEDQLPSVRKTAGGRFDWRANRLMLVMYAYRLETFQISGIEPERATYTIRAETDAATSEEQLRLMLQRLLQERLGLAVHRENKERPVYALTIARGGPRMKELKPDDPVSGPPDFLKGKTLPEKQIMNLMEGHPVIIGRRVTIAQLLPSLVDEMRGFVEDKTGLTGSYDIDLSYLSSNRPAPPGAFEEVPHLDAALTEQLGLKLERRTGTVPMLIVDHFEKTPTEN